MYLESCRTLGTCIARHIICRKLLAFRRLDRLASCVNNMYLLGFRSSIPSHTPLANWVVPMNRTTPKSAPVTKTLIPVSRVTLGREERERVEEEREGGWWGSEEEEGGLVRETVRGCLARGPVLNACK